MFNLFGYNIIFANSNLLWLLLLIPIIGVLKYFLQKNRGEHYTISNIPSAIIKSPTPSLIKWKWILDLLFYLALSFIIIALARPQTIDSEENINANGIDIVLCMDVSGSMMAEDFKPNRLESAKQISEQFVISRPSDRIGLVIFSGESFTQCPLTLDHRIVIEQLKQIQNGLLRDGTAIGNGLGTAIDRLKDGKGKSKVVILMTDGEESKMGGNTIDPNTALQIAKAYNVKVYTVGVGSIGKAMTPVKLPNGTIQRQLMDVRIDEALLKKIATETGGNYYRATNNTSLENVYKEIDKLEKTKIDMTSFKNFKDLFPYLLIPALLLLLIMSIVKFTIFRTITD